MAIEPCPPSAPAPVRGIVVFDPVEFVAAYPVFDTLANPLMASAFTVATLFLNNSCCSVVQDANVRQELLYMLTAHICALLYGENGTVPSGLVGRVDKAQEGTVSVSAAYASIMTMTDAYFVQTKYGAMFWQATLPFRLMYYIPPVANACIGRGAYPVGPRGYGGC